MHAGVGPGPRPRDSFERGGCVVRGVGVGYSTLRVFRIPS